MKIQCDVCEKAEATMICCADEAALCGECDVQIHAANKLAGKHSRLLLQGISSKFPTCEICQEKYAFIFCVEDRALLCKQCDESIHSTNNLATMHQRYLATGVQVALSSSSGCANDNSVEKQIDPNPPTSKFKPASNHSWAVEEELLHFSDKEQQLELNKHEMSTVAEVPQLHPTLKPNYVTAYRPAPKLVTGFKKPGIEIGCDENDYYTVPDLG